MLRSLLGISMITLALAACGGEDGTSTGAGGGGTTTTTTAGGGGDSAGTGGAAGTGGGGTGGIAEAKTYVILGDSISDGGGTGPFFYDLLAANDDGKYPEWKGKDLKTRFGQDLAIVKNSKGGAVSGNLPSQVANLPASLTGPVIVTITIGGNDMQANAIQILQGQDQGARDKFRENLSAAIGELTKPGRFGEGVEVIVFEADIYDPTDGKGDFKKQGCPAPLSFLPETPTDPFFGNWNAVVHDEVPKHGASVVTLLHDHFTGHGLGTMEQWYYKDCIHPNSAGHNELRRVFWEAITGQTTQ